MIKRFIHDMHNWDDPNVFTVGGIAGSFIGIIVTIALSLSPLWPVAIVLGLLMGAYWALPYCGTTSRVLRGNCSKRGAYWAYDRLPDNVKKELPSIGSEDILRWTDAECNTFERQCDKLLEKYNKRDGVVGDSKYEIFMENANNMREAMDYIEKELSKIHA